MEDRSEKKIQTQDPEFYNAAAKYWDKIPSTIDGMLGGFGFISQTDIKGSMHFLRTIFELKSPPKRVYALDCGAGIGRITQSLLIKYFKCVDLVEQNPKFLEVAKQNLESYGTKVGNFYPTGLQSFCPEPDKYDVIWCQWVLGHLRDEDLIQFFQKCRAALRNNGVLIVKENVTSSNDMEIDATDSSVTRPLRSLHTIFEKSGLHCLKEKLQTKFPHGLYPVYMFALRPNKDL